MTVQYSWVVDQMSTYPSFDGKSDVVYEIKWHVDADENGKNFRHYGITPIKYDGSKEFTPYNQLTKDMVIGWVKDCLGAEVISSIEKELADGISIAKNPKSVVNPLPW